MEKVWIVSRGGSPWNAPWTPPGVTRCLIRYWWCSPAILPQRQSLLQARVIFLKCWPDLVFLPTAALRWDFPSQALCPKVSSTASIGLLPQKGLMVKSLRNTGLNQIQYGSLLSTHRVFIVHGVLPRGESSQLYSQSLLATEPFLLQEHPLPPVWKTLGILLGMELLRVWDFSQTFLSSFIPPSGPSSAHRHVSILQNPLLCSNMLHPPFPPRKSTPSPFGETALAFQGPAQISPPLWPLPLPTEYAIGIPFNKGMTSLLAFHTTPSPPPQEISSCRAGPWMIQLWTPGARPTQDRCSIMLSKYLLFSQKEPLHAK